MTSDPTEGGGVALPPATSDPADGGSTHLVVLHVPVGSVLQQRQGGLHVVHRCRPVQSRLACDYGMDGDGNEGRNEALNL